MPGFSGVPGSPPSFSTSCRSSPGATCGDVTKTIRSPSSLNLPPRRSMRAIKFSARSCLIGDPPVLIETHDNLPLALSAALVVRVAPEQLPSRRFKQPKGLCRFACDQILCELFIRDVVDLAGLGVTPIQQNCPQQSNFHDEIPLLFRAAFHRGLGD